jgi:hypothetical protein
MNIVRKLDLTTVAAAGGANPLSTAGQGDADDGQVLATERPPDGLMPPRKKRRGSARQQTALSALVADSAGVGGADTQHRSPSADESEASSQQAAADSVYHEFLRSLTPEQLDFVRKDEQWPAIRTSANKTAKPSGAPHKKGDWSSQRSGFIKQVFLQMHAASEVDENTLLDNMFDCGKYSWLKDTARVTRAVQAHYNGKTRAKAFTALFQLCEINIKL